MYLNANFQNHRYSENILLTENRYEGEKKSTHFDATQILSSIFGMDGYCTSGSSVEIDSHIK